MTEEGEAGGVKSGGNDSMKVRWEYVKKAAGGREVI